MNEVNLAPKRRWRFVPLLLLFVFVAIVGYLYSQWPPGFEFPPPENIFKVKATLIDLDGKEQAFDVPRSSFSEVFQALSPSRYDAWGSKMMMMGSLEIQMDDSSTINVNLYDRAPKSTTGAFSIWKPKVGYRGGNSAELRTALERALEKSKQP